MQMKIIHVIEATPSLLYITPEEQEYAVLCVNDRNMVFLRTEEGWVALGKEFNSNVSALTAYKGQLISGGNFINAGGVEADKIAKWNGTEWLPLGCGIQGSCCSFTYVAALAVYENDLIVGGQFTTAGGVRAKNIAKWNGTDWSSLGKGMNGWVNALTVYNGELIAGGDFTSAGEIVAAGQRARRLGVRPHRHRWQPDR